MQFEKLIFEVSWADLSGDFKFIPPFYSLTLRLF